MKLFRIILASVSSILLLSACEDDLNRTDPSSMDGFDGSDAKTVEVAASNTGTTLVGMGVELDPHFLSQNVTRNDGAKAEDWDDIVVERCKAMKIQRYRVMVQPHWWEPYNDDDDPDNFNWDAFTFDNTEMKSLYAVLDLAEETGAEVLLNLWGCRINASTIDGGKIGKHFLAGEGDNWVVGTDNPTEFAENFVALLKHLIEDKHYTCVTEITPYNEPDGNVTSIKNYINDCIALDTRLNKEGLRDKIKLNLSDNIDNDFTWLSNTASYLNGTADIMNSHTYIFGYTTKNSTVINWEKKNVNKAREAGVQHFVGEFGSDQCVGATRQRDINIYKRGVLMARHVINFLNAGAAGASYWSLIDQYYGRYESYAQMQQLGLWIYVKRAYEKEDLGSIKSNYGCRPQYYSYSMLTRFIRKGSTVYSMDMGDELIAGTAVCTEDGKWTYVISNNTDNDRSWFLKNSHEQGMENCQVYKYIEGSLPQYADLIQSSGTLTQKDGAFKVYVPAQSVLVLSQIQE